MTEVEERVIKAARAMDAFIQMVDSGMTVFPFDPEHPDSQQNVYVRVADELRAAVEALDYSDA